MQSLACTMIGWPCGGLGAERAEPAEDVGGPQPGQRHAAGAVHAQPIEPARTGRRRHQHDLGTVRFGEPQGQRLGDDRRGEVLVLQVDRAPRLGDRIERQRASTPAPSADRARPARSARSRPLRRSGRALARAARGRRHRSVRRAGAGPAPPRRWRAASAHAQARPAPAPHRRRPASRPRAGAGGSSSSGRCGARRRRDAPGCPSDRRRSRPPPQNAIWSSTTSTFWWWQPASGTWLSSRNLTSELANQTRARWGKKSCDASIGSADFQIRTRMSIPGRAAASSSSTRPISSGSSPRSNPSGSSRVRGSKPQPSRSTERRAAFNAASTAAEVVLAVDEEGDAAGRVRPASS